MSYDQRTHRSNSGPGTMHGIGTIIGKDVKFKLLDDDMEYLGHVDRADFIARAVQMDTEQWNRWFPLEAFAWIEQVE